VISLVPSVIFLTIVLSYRHFLIRTTTKKPVPKLTTKGTVIQTTQTRIMNQTDTITLGTLIVSIVATGILPITLSPLLDYSGLCQITLRPIVVY
jgi:hypothetical protein